MKPETKQVMWEWLPGIVAGLMPLCVFAVVSVFAEMDGLPEGHIDVHRAGWTAHFLVLAIVTSTVSTFTAYPRLFAENMRGEAIGMASLGLVMVNTLILVFSASIYTLHEQYNPKSDLLALALVVAFLSGLMSLWLEFAIANLRLRRGGIILPQDNGSGD